MMDRKAIKKILGEIPYTAELYWQLVQRYKPRQAHFNLDFLESVLPEAVEQAQQHLPPKKPGKRVFLFASLHYWIEFSALLGVALAGLGHDVTLSFLPYASWDQTIQKFDLRRQNLYARQVLRPANAVLKVQSLLDVRPLSRQLPAQLEKQVEQVSVFDTQYTLQVEDVTKEEEIYQLRYARNTETALNARAWLRAHKPEVAVIPNATILEMGVVYHVARDLQIPTVTFEFSDQREHIWLAQNKEIMRHETDELWEAKGDEPLEDAQVQRLQELFAAREGGRTWKNFTRKWQEMPTEGAGEVREKLGLDDRPVVLLATNVLGDSLTLGRQVFSRSMADWIERTVRFFAKREDVQLVIRVHPGETLTHGTSMVDVIRAELGEIPPQIHLIDPKEKINTYDLLEFADLGLVYTTTVGLEMAMRGIPVVVAGQTHYRKRGFTYNPDSWEAYFEALEGLLAGQGSGRLSQDQVTKAWHYAHLFFFDFPKPFPWHLLDLKEDFKERPISFILSEEGHARYGETFDALTGGPIHW
jgi:hypothetical protein